MLCVDGGMLGWVGGWVDVCVRGWCVCVCVFYCLRNRSLVEDVDVMC